MGKEERREGKRGASLREAKGNTRRESNSEEEGKKGKKGAKERRERRELRMKEEAYERKKMKASGYKTQRKDS